MPSLIRRGLNFLAGRPTAESDTPPVQPSAAVADLIKQRPWGGYGHGPTGENYCGETPEVRRRYREMMRCPWVKIGFLSKVWGVAAQDLQIVPDDPEDDRSKLLADFHRDNILNADGGLRALAESVLFGPGMDGYGLCHMKARTADRGRWAGKRVLDRLAPKDSDFWDFVVDDYRKVVGVRDRYREEGEPEILPLTEFVVVRHLQMFDSVYGMSDFRAADQAYCCLDAARKLRLIYLDKCSGLIAQGKYDDDKIKASLLQSLIELRASGAVVYPQGSEVTITEMAMSAADAFHQIEADLEQEIVTSFTGAFLQTMAGQSGVQRGSSAEHATTADLFRWYLSQLVCDVINAQIIPRFTDDNFAGSPAYPKAVLTGVNPADVVADLAIDQALFGMNLPLSKKELYRRAGRTPPADDADTLVAVPATGPGGPVDPTAPPTDPNADPNAPPTEDELAATADILAGVYGADDAAQMLGNA